MIDSGIHRDVIRGHLARCEPCNALLRFAREREDCAALAAWRVQLAEHLDTERATRAYETQVRRTLSPSGMTHPVSSVKAS